MMEIELPALSLVQKVVHNPGITVANICKTKHLFTY